MIFSKKNTYFCIILILWVAFALRTYALGDYILSPDDSYDYNRWISASWWAIVVDDILINNHTFTHLLTRLMLVTIGDELFALRFVSVNLSILGIVGIYKLGSIFFCRYTGLVSALLLTISPVSLAYVHSFRGYTAVITLSIASVLFSYLSVCTNYKRYWLVFTISSILMVYTHLFTLLGWFNLTILMVIGGLKRKTRFFWKWCIASFIAVIFTLFIFYLPIEVEMAKNFLEHGLNIEEANVLLLQKPKEMASLSTNLAWFSYFRQVEITPQAIFSLLMLIGSLYLTRVKAYRNQILLLWLFILIPFVQIKAMSFMWNDFWVRPVYMLFVFFSFLMLISLTIAKLPQTLIQRQLLAQILSLGLLVVLVGLWYPVIKNQYLGRTQGMLETSNYFQTQLGPNDLIVCLKWEEPYESGETSCTRTLNFQRKTNHLDTPSEIVVLYDLINDILPRAHGNGTLNRHGNIWIVIYSVPQSVQLPPPETINLVSFNRYGRTIVLSSRSNDSYLINLRDTLTYLNKLHLTEHDNAAYKLMLAVVLTAKGEPEQAQKYLDSVSSSTNHYLIQLEKTQKLVETLQLRNMVEKVDTNFDNQILWQGHSLSRINKNKMKISFFWQALTKIRINYNVFIHLQDEQGNVIGQFDFQPFSGNYPTEHWQPNQDLVEERLIVIPEELTAGNYRFFAGFYDPQTMLRLDTDTVDDNSILLGEIIVGNN